MGEVGDTEIQTADTASYLARCRRSRPPKRLWVVPRRCGVGMGLRGLRLARVAGGVVGYIGACDAGVSGLACRCFSPTCHDDEAKVRRGAHGAECRRQKESTQEGDRTLGACRGRSCSFSTIMGVASSWLPQRVHVRAVSPQERARSVRGSHGASHFQHSSVKGAAPHFGWLGALGGVGEVGERASHHVGGSTVG